jgi:RimJ/RimL family protein N-acetyltransferase
MVSLVHTPASIGNVGGFFVSRMSQIIYDPQRVWQFVNDRAGAPRVDGMQGIGLERDGELIAGVLYEGFTGHNIWMHVAAEPGGRWLNRAYLKTCFAYPFLQLGCRRISGWVEASNLEARRFDEHLGFRSEAALEGAARDGGDVIVYVMWRDECRFLKG